MKLKAGLIFEFQGAKQFELNEEGKFSEATINDNATSSPTSSALLFDHQGQTALWAENDHTINFAEDFETKTTAFPATGLLVQNPTMLQVAEILSIGRLYIAGENRQLVSAVAYADATALLEWNPSLGGYELKYHNIITPEGIEGRIEYPGNAAIYYIKDHLGSIREVISEQGAMSESVQYHSYGNQDKTLVSSVEARETFTGKEYDEDGEVNGAAGINLYYFGARYFDPETGIWLSTDAMEQCWNPYAYAPNPILYTDSDGNLFGIDDALVVIIVGAIIGATAGGVSGYQAAEAAGAEGWDMFGYIAGGAIIGGVIGGVTGAAGAGVTAGISSGVAAIGAASNATWLATGAIANTMISGAIGGAVAGAYGGAMNALAFGGVSEGLFCAGTGEQILEGMMVGVKFGAIGGAVGGALQSNEFASAGKWVSEKIGTGAGKLANAIGMNPSKFEINLFGFKANLLNIGSKLLQGAKQAAEYGPLALSTVGMNSVAILNTQYSLFGSSYESVWGSKATKWLYKPGEGIYLKKGTGGEEAIDQVQEFLKDERTKLIKKIIKKL